jgi:hypothetical protein
VGQIPAAVAAQARREEADDTAFPAGGGVAYDPATSRWSALLASPLQGRPCASRSPIYGRVTYG